MNKDHYTMPTIRPFRVGALVPMSPHETTYDPDPSFPNLTTGPRGTMCGAPAGGNAEAGCVCEVLDEDGRRAMAICSVCDFREELRLNDEGFVVTSNSRFKSRW